MNLRVRRRSEIVIATLFLVLLLLPGTAWFTQLTRTQSEAEGRRLAERPAWPRNRSELRVFPDAFELYMSEHMGLRKLLLDLNARLHLAVGASFTPKVVVGRGGWLFLGEAANHYRNIGPLPRGHLQNWYAGHVANQEWLAKRGIPYVLVVAPDKHTLYGEFMPARFRVLGGPSGYDLAVELVHRRGELNLIDLRPDLRKAKTRLQVYHKTDSHWNLWGADVAQYRIAVELSRYFPNLRPMHFDSWIDVLPATRVGGGSARMLHSARRLLERNVPVLRGAKDLCPQGVVEKLPFSTVGNCLATSDRCERAPVENPFGLGDRTRLPHGGAFEIVCNGAATDATVLVFRDSFYSDLVPLISSYFTRTIHVWAEPRTPLRDYFVDSFKPDLVLAERIERHAFPTPHVPGMTGYLTNDELAGRK